MALTLLDAALSFAEDISSKWMSGKFVISIRQKVFAHLQTLSPDFFNRHAFGDLLTRLTSDASAIERVVLSGIGDTVSNILRIALFAGVMVYLDWQLAALSLVALPCFLLVARSFSARLKELSRAQRRVAANITVVAEEVLSNAALVQAYNRQEFETERLAQENRRNLASQIAIAKLRGLFVTVVDLIELAGTLLVVSIGPGGFQRAP